MAPVTVTCVGVPHQKIDDPGLVSLLKQLSQFGTSPQKERPSGIGKHDPADPVDVVGLVQELQKWRHWRFQEQVRVFIVLGEFYNNFVSNLI